MFTGVSFFWEVGTLPASRDSHMVGYLPPPDIRPGYLPLLLTSGGHHWRPVQTVHLRSYPPPPNTGTDIQWTPPRGPQKSWLARKHFSRMRAACFLGGGHHRPPWTLPRRKMGPGTETPLAGTGSDITQRSPPSLVDRHL